MVGGKDPNRRPKLRSLTQTPPGWIWLAACNSCGHRGPMPVHQLIRKFEELHVVKFALISLKCTACGGRGASALMLKLCDPGCPRQRG